MEALQEKSGPGVPVTRFLLTKELEGPNSPPRDKRNEMFVAHNNAALVFGDPQLKMNIVT